MDALNLSPSELEGMKEDLLGFVHRVTANNEQKRDSEIAALPAVVSLLLQNTGVMRLSGEQLRTVVNTLAKAEYEMVTTNGLVATDRPDLPLTPDTLVEIDYSKVLEDINEAISILDMSVYSRRSIRV